MSGPGPVSLQSGPGGCQGRACGISLCQDPCIPSPQGCDRHFLARFMKNLGSC
jgi:hypothetical protein